MKGGGDLSEKPGIPYRTPTHHQACGGSLSVIIESRLGIHHIAVGDHRAIESLGGLLDQRGSDGSLIAIRDCAGMDRQAVDGVLAENFQNALKLIGAVKSEAGFYGETSRDRIPQRAEDGIDLIRVTQQTTAGIFPVNHGCGAAEIEIDSSHGILAEFSRGAHQFFDIATDHLGEDGPARGILGDGAQDVGVRARVDVNAEIFRHEPIGQTAFGKHAHEGQIRHVLHRCKHKGGALFWQKISHLGCQEMV